jgi:GT2 family glycosyltransferase
MTVSIIIVNYNGLAYTRQCLESFFRYHNGSEYDVIVVDNHSSDGSQKELPLLFPDVRCIALSENAGFGPANNIGAEAAKGTILFFVNNDTLFTMPVVNELAARLSNDSSVGIVGPKLLNEDGSFQLSFGRFPTVAAEAEARQLSKDAAARQQYAPLNDDPKMYDWVTGAAFMIRKDVFIKVKGFDERFFMYFEDIDLCRKVRDLGFNTSYHPALSMVHFGGKSYGNKDPRIVAEYRRSQLRYYDLHNSFGQRALLRVFLVLKFFPQLFRTADRSVARRIIALALTRHKGEVR